MEVFAEIEVGSEAWKVLFGMMTHPDTYMVRLALDPVDGDGIKVKVNDGIWSLPMATQKALPKMAEPVRQPPHEEDFDF